MKIRLVETVERSDRVVAPVERSDQLVDALIGGAFTKEDRISLFDVAFEEIISRYKAGDQGVTEFQLVRLGNARRQMLNQL